MRKDNPNVNICSRKGVTLVELVVSMTLVALFSVVCVSLINPIERIYQHTVKLSHAQLIADTVVDSIRKECNDVDNSDEGSVWIAKGSANGTDSDLYNGPVSSVYVDPDKSGSVLVMRKNGNYCEAIFSCFKITEANLLAVENTGMTGTSYSHAAKSLSDENNKANLNSGYVHFGYYQAIDNSKGVTPDKNKIYDYTNPITASTYEGYTVSLSFENLQYKEDENHVKHPTFVECVVNVYDGDYTKPESKRIYTRKTVISFSPNGSGKGTNAGGGGGTSATKKGTVTVRWVDSDGKAIAWPSTIPSVDVTLMVNDTPVSTNTVTNNPPKFGYSLNVSGKLSVSSTDLESSGYTYKATGKPNGGFIVTYKRKKVQTVKLVSGSYIKGKIGTDVTSVIFGKYDDYKDQVTGISSLDFAIDINATNDNTRKHDYRYFRVGKTAYILSDDGTFVANENCSYMFSGYTNLESITWPMESGAFDTSRTTKMEQMFLNCKKLKQFNLPDNFICSHCTTTEKMFEECNSATSIRIVGWNTSGVTTMNRMFMNFATSTDVEDKVSVNISCFSFKSCKKLGKLFYSDKKDSNNNSLSRIYRIVFPVVKDFDDVDTMDAMLSGLASLEELENFKNVEAPLVTTMKNLFHNCYKLGSKNDGVVDISGFKFPKCTSMEETFTGLRSMTTLKMNNCDLRLCNNFNKIFNGSSYLTVIEIKNSDFSALTALSNFNLVKNLDLSGSTFGVTGLETTFGKKKSSKVETLNLTGTKLPNCTTAKNMFSEGPIKSVIFKDIEVPKLEDCSYMFSGCAFTEFNLSDFKFGACTTMEGMFNNCKQVTKITMSIVEVPKCTTALSMFNNCYALKEVHISNFAANKLTNCSYMFANCYSLSIGAGDITGWDTSSVTDMSYMFQHACYRGTNYGNLPKTAELDLSFMSFANVENFYRMVNVETKANDALKLVILPSGDKAVTNAASVNLSGMFRRRNNLAEIRNLRYFSVTNSISDATAMFADNICTTLDIRSLDITKIPDGKAQYMFNEASMLEKIIVMDKDYTSFAAGQTGVEMFKLDSSLVGQNGTPFSVANGSYARIDDPDNGKPGYFTSENYTPPEDPNP
ncbi:MAG: BspA family leucine-rich repeat surface protein [Clostridiales bacterium]|nr:BspA family leucine-rich repeat surface protein [Clostridiales bacterium]